MNFNSTPSHIMHIDLNACFASIEQQANPFLRNRPVAVAAYPSPNGCILAASYEAKRMGVKTGMRVKDGRLFCKNLVVLGTDPQKYRHIHRAFRKLLKKYTWDFVPKSIDEFVLHFDEVLPIHNKSMEEIALDIKHAIQRDIGDYLKVSIGIAPNRFLAKQAAGLTKPDGLETIDITNYEEIFKRLPVMSLTGIKTGNAARLFAYDIYTVWDMYAAPVWKLKAAFKSITSSYWHMRLHGYEIDRVEFARRSYGNSYALPKPFIEIDEITPILMKLTTKMSSRIRKAGLAARGIHLTVAYRDGTSYHRGYSTPRDLWCTEDFYEAAVRVLHESPRKPVRNVAVSAFNLRESTHLQLNLFTDINKALARTEACDTLNNRYGPYTVTSARMLPAEQSVPDRIAFGNVKELEELMKQGGEDE